MTQFDAQYQDVLRKIMNSGSDEYNERTGHHLKVLPGINFELDYGFPLLTLRRIPIKLFVAEMIWYIMGSNNPDDFVNKFTSIWKDFTEDDGTVKAAYGYRWRHHFGRDQLCGLINHLKENPGSRHAVVVTWDPKDDGLGAIGTFKKNVPCPYTFTANIIDNKLHVHNIIRSNDIILGCPHDIAGFYLLQCILSAKIGVKSGKLTTSISNAHIYDIHYDAAQELLGRFNEHAPIYFDAKENYFDRAEKGDELLVEEIVEALEKQYNPLSSIKNLKIVL